MDSGPRAPVPTPGFYQNVMVSVFRVLGGGVQNLAKCHPIIINEPCNIVNEYRLRERVATGLGGRMTKAGTLVMFKTSPGSGLLFKSLGKRETRTSRVSDL